MYNFPCWLVLPLISCPIQGHHFLLIGAEDLAFRAQAQTAHAKNAPVHQQHGLHPWHRRLLSYQRGVQIRGHIRLWIVTCRKKSWQPLDALIRSIQAAGLVGALVMASMLKILLRFNEICILFLWRYFSHHSQAGHVSEDLYWCRALVRLQFLSRSSWIAFRYLHYSRTETYLITTLGVPTPVLVDWLHAVASTSPNIWNFINLRHRSAVTSHSFSV